MKRRQFLPLLLSPFISPSRLVRPVEMRWCTLKKRWTDGAAVNAFYTYTTPDGPRLLETSTGSGEFQENYVMRNASNTGGFFVPVFQYDLQTAVNMVFDEYAKRESERCNVHIIINPNVRQYGVLVTKDLECLVPQFRSITRKSCEGALYGFDRVELIKLGYRRYET